MYTPVADAIKCVGEKEEEREEGEVVSGVQLDQSDY